MTGRLGLRGALAAACLGAGLGEAQAQTYTVITNSTGRPAMGQAF
jgi:hypothetical protein